MDIQKLFFVTISLITALTLGGCEEPPQSFVASSRPVKTMVIGGDVSGDVRTFPAVVDAIQKGKADAALAASIFHFGQFTISETKQIMRDAGIPVRLESGNVV